MAHFLRTLFTEKKSATVKNSRKKIGKVKNFNDRDLFIFSLDLDDDDKHPGCD